MNTSAANTHTKPPATTSPATTPRPATKSPTTETLPADQLPTEPQLARFRSRGASSETDISTTRRNAARRNAARDHAARDTSTKDTAATGTSTKDTAAPNTAAPDDALPGDTTQIAGVMEAELGPLDKLEPQTLANLSDKELFALTVTLEETMAAIQARSMHAYAAAASRHAYRSGGFRSAATGLSARTRLSRATCGRRFNQASILVNKLPDLHEAFQAGIITSDHINLICRLYDRKILKPHVPGAQSYFLEHAGEPWPIFRLILLAWAQAIEDHFGPDSEDKTFRSRKLVRSRALDKEVLGEFHMPSDLFEQFLEIVRPFYDAYLRDEVRDARLAAGEDPELAPAEGEFFDLARSDSQRWLDALMAALRMRGAQMSKLRAEAIRSGADADAPFNVDLDDLDAGVAAEVIIIADQETMEREIARQNGDELQPRSNESTKNYRCETLSGIPVTPTTALQYLQVGSFRRLLLSPNSLDFSISERARFARGAKRLGLIARDRICRDPGCGTPARACEGDHIHEYSKGGKTVPTNLKMRCSPCHRHKTKLQSAGLWTGPSSASEPEARHLQAL